MGGVGKCFTDIDRRCPEEAHWLFFENFPRVLNDHTRAMVMPWVAVVTGLFHAAVAGVALVCGVALLAGSVVAWPLGGKSEWVVYWAKVCKVALGALGCAVFVEALGMGVFCLGPLFKAVVAHDLKREASRSGFYGLQKYKLDEGEGRYWAFLGEGALEALDEGRVVEGLAAVDVPALFGFAQRVEAVMRDYLVRKWESEGEVPQVLEEGPGDFFYWMTTPGLAVITGLCHTALGVFVAACGAFGVTLSATVVPLGLAVVKGMGYLIGREDLKAIEVWAQAVEVVQGMAKVTLLGGAIVGVGLLGEALACGLMCARPVYMALVAMTLQKEIKRVASETHEAPRVLAAKVWQEAAAVLQGLKLEHPADYLTYFRMRLLIHLIKGDKLKF